MVSFTSTETEANLIIQQLCNNGGIVQPQHNNTAQSCSRFLRRLRSDLTRSLLCLNDESVSTKTSQEPASEDCSELLQRGDRRENMAIASSCSSCLRKELVNGTADSMSGMSFA